MHQNLWALALTGVFLAFAACGGDDSSPASKGTGATGGSSGGAGGGPGGSGGTAGIGGTGGQDPGPPESPSGFLLLTSDRLEALRAEVESGSAAWQFLRSNVDAEMDTLDQYRTGPENIALVYLLTGDATYAASAYDWAVSIMDNDDPTFDSYLHFGNIMREIAFVRNYCGDALDATQRSRLEAYLDRWTNELWFDNQGSGWGLEDPGNNYHMAFLEGTAYAGYALREAGHPNGQKYIDILLDKLTRADGVMPYLDTRAKGGDWPEGTNYGQRSKQRLFSALGVVASMGDPVFFRASPFFAETVLYALYQIQPGGEFIYPAGDVARDSMMPVTPYEREIVQTATYWIKDDYARPYGRWFLQNVVPDYTGPSFNARASYFLDVIYNVEGETQTPESLPLFYRSPGTEWLNVRSGWDDGATSLTISAPTIIDQSHAHYDAGSFTMWKGGWQAVDAVTFSNDGLNWDSDAHNMLHVEGGERREGPTPGLKQFEADDGFAYVQVDASNLYRVRVGTDLVPLMQEVTREMVYLAPDTLVLFDRAVPGTTQPPYDLRFHFASQPTQSQGLFTGSHEGGSLAVQVLLGGNASITNDGDLVDGNSSAWRVQVAPSGAPSRFVSVAKVAAGASPSLSASLDTSVSSVRAVVLPDAVVVASDSAFGKAAALPFSYRASAGARKHVLVNIDEAVRIDTSTQGGDTVYTVSSGSTYTPSAAGVVRFDG